MLLMYISIVGKDFIPPSRPQVCVATKEGQKAVTDAIMFLSGKARTREALTGESEALSTIAADLAKRWASGGAAPGNSMIMIMMMMTMIMIIIIMMMVFVCVCRECGRG